MPRRRISADRLAALSARALQPVVDQARQAIQSAMPGGRPEELADEFNFKDLLDRLCVVLGRAVGHFLRLVWAEEDGGDPPEAPAWDRDYYLWPGYTRWSGRSAAGERADVPEREPPVRSPDQLRAFLRDKRYGVGAAARATADPPPEHIALAVWYKALYSQSFGGYRFDGFHQWFKENRRMEIRPAGGESRPLTGVLIRCLPTAARRYRRDLLLNSGLLPIDLDPGAGPRELLFHLAEPLNGDRVSTPGESEVLLHGGDDGPGARRPDYPFPPFRVPTPGGPRAVRLDTLEGEHSVPYYANQFVFSLILHSILFGGVCRPRWDDGPDGGRVDAFRRYVHDALDGLRATGERFPGLAEATAAGLELLTGADGVPYRDRRFTHYYVIPLQKGVRFGSDRRQVGEDVGTVNLYVNRPVPPAALAAIRGAAEEVYLQLRFAEAAGEAIRIGQLRRENDFSHNMAAVTETLLYSPRVADLDEWDRLPIWHLAATVKDVYSGRPYAPDVPLDQTTGVAAKFWPTDNRDLLRVLTTFAVLHGYRRSTRRPDGRRVRDDAPRLTAEELADRTRRLQLAEDVSRRGAAVLVPQGSLTQPRVVAALEAALGVVPPDPPPKSVPWVRTNGFVMYYHHALWQAVFHGFLAYFRDRTADRAGAGPYVVIAFHPDGTGFEVRNRAAWPPLPGASGRGEKGFFAQLNEMQGTDARTRFRVRGPERIDPPNSPEIWFQTTVRVLQTDNPT